MLGTLQAKKIPVFGAANLPRIKLKEAYCAYDLYPKWLLSKEFPEYINLFKNLMCRNRYPIPGIDNNYLHNNLCQSIFTIKF
jgi:hypothetical protein